MVESKVKLTKYDLALLSHTYDIRICAASELPQGKSSIQYPDKWTIGTYVYSYIHVHHHQNDKLFFYINALTNARSASIYKFVTQNEYLSFNNSNRLIQYSTKLFFGLFFPFIFIDFCIEFFIFFLSVLNTFFFHSSRVCIIF